MTEHVPRRTATELGAKRTPDAQQASRRDAAIDALINLRLMLIIKVKLAQLAASEVHKSIAGSCGRRSHKYLWR